MQNGTAVKIEVRQLWSNIVSTAGRGGEKNCQKWGQDLRFSECCGWRFKLSRMWHSVTGLIKQYDSDSVTSQKSWIFKYVLDWGCCIYLFHQNKRFFFFLLVLDKCQNKLSFCGIIWIGIQPLSTSGTQSTCYISWYTLSNKNPSAWNFVSPEPEVTCGTVAIIIRVVLRLLNLKLKH